MHLKSLTTPKTWSVKRKGKTFTTRPYPHGAPQRLVLPLNVVFKDLLHYAQTTREVKYLLHTKTVAVNAQRRKDVHDALGFMDVLSIDDLKEAYRLLLDAQGHLMLVKIPPAEASVKPCKVVGQTCLKKARLMLHLYDGGNLLIQKSIYHRGDTVMFNFQTKKIVQHLSLEKGGYVYIFNGRYSGCHGIVDEIDQEFVTLKTEQGTIKTLREYGLALGEQKSLITLP